MFSVFEGSIIHQQAPTNMWQGCHTLLPDGFHHIHGCCADSCKCHLQLTKSKDGVFSDLCERCAVWNFQAKDHQGDCDEERIKDQQEKNHLILQRRTANVASCCFVPKGISPLDDGFSICSSEQQQNNWCGTIYQITIWIRVPICTYYTRYIHLRTILSILATKLPSESKIPTV